MRWWFKLLDISSIYYLDSDNVVASSWDVEGDHEANVWECDGQCDQER